jgi:hypothetical protein
MSSFNKTEYHNNHPEQGVSVMGDVRDNKSHSNTYYKQVDKRNQLPNLQGAGHGTQLKRPTKQVSLTYQNLCADMANTQLGDEDAYAELEIEYDIEGDAEEYEAEMARRSLGQRLRVLEKEIQDVQEEEGRLQLIQDAGKNDYIHRQGAGVLAGEMRHLEMKYTLVAMDDDKMDRHEAHLHNLASLDEYYASLVNNDAEYEFWLQFEINEYECGNHVDVVVRCNDDDNVATNCAVDDEDRYEYDADDRMQDEIENRREEAMEEAMEDR